MAICHGNVTEVKRGGVVVERNHGPHQWVLEKRWSHTTDVNVGYLTIYTAEFYCSFCTDTRRDTKSRISGFEGEFV